MPCSRGTSPASLYLDLTVYEATSTENPLSPFFLGCWVYHYLFGQIGSERLGSLSEITQQVIDRAWTPFFQSPVGLSTCLGA